MEQNIKNKVITVISIILSIIIVIAIILGINLVKANALKRTIMSSSWTQIKGDGSGTHINKILEFSSKEITYRIETGFPWLDTTMATYDYKVLSNKKIQVNMLGYLEKCKVKLSNDNTIMTIIPALTSTEPYEVWYR